jgi:serine/threonine protein kinase
VATYFTHKPVHKPPFTLTPSDLEPMLLFHKARKIHFSGHIVIADFGSSYLTSSPSRPTGSGRTVTISPERLRHLTYDLPSDIWSLGCAIIEILSGREIWRPSVLDEGDVGEQILEKIRGALGLETEGRDEFGERRTLEELIGEMWLEGIEEEERSLLKGLVEGTFRWKPEERMSIGEVVRSAWLVG